MCPQSELRATGDQDRSAPISMISGLPVANLDKPACPTPRYLRRHVVVLLAAASRAAAVIHLYGRGGAARSGPFNTLRFQMNIAAACAFRLTIIFFHEDLLFQHQRRRARAHALVQLNASACAVACDLVGPAASAGVTAARRELSQVRVIQLHVGLDCSLLIARGLHAGYERGDRRDPALAEGIGTSRLVLGAAALQLGLDVLGAGTCHQPQEHLQGVLCHLDIGRAADQQPHYSTGEDSAARKDELAAESIGHKAGKVGFVPARRVRRP